MKVVSDVLPHLMGVMAEPQKVVNDPAAILRTLGSVGGPSPSMLHGLLGRYSETLHPGLSQLLSCAGQEASMHSLPAMVKGFREQGISHFLTRE